MPDVRSRDIAQVEHGIIHYIRQLLYGVELGAGSIYCVPGSLLKSEMSENARSNVHYSRRISVLDIFR